MNKQNKQAQIFSLDTIIGVVIFLVVFTIFFGIISKNAENEGVQGLSNQGEQLINQMTIAQGDGAQNKILIIDNGQLDEDKLQNFADTFDYDTLKTELGIDGEFCIFFEDENGNIVDMSDITSDYGIYGYGSDKISVSGSSCYSN
jgi:hypothetical protein